MALRKRRRLKKLDRNPLKPAAAPHIEPVVKPVVFKSKKNWDRCFVIASGPSLTEEDIEIVRNMDVKVIVTNDTWRIVPWADVLFFHDRKWWNHYKDEIDFKGEIVTWIDVKDPRVTRERIKAYGNSGAGAISLAVHYGCKWIGLLGVDCQYDDDKRHWHGDHPKPLGNARSVKKWHSQFANIPVGDVEVVNYSRNTALTCFKKDVLTQD
jgi:hypothetical protein